MWEMHGKSPEIDGMQVNSEEMKTTYHLSYVSNQVQIQGCVEF